MFGLQVCAVIAVHLSFMPRVLDVKMKRMCFCLWQLRTGLISCSTKRIVQTLNKWATVVIGTPKETITYKQTIAVLMNMMTIYHAALKESNSMKLPCILHAGIIQLMVFAYCQVYSALNLAFWVWSRYAVSYEEVDEKNFFTFCVKKSDVNLMQKIHKLNDVDK